MAVGCSSGTDEETGENAQEATGNISITGTIVDAAGNPISGISVALTGAASRTTTTSPNGGYSFTGLAAGSYSVRPTKSSCTLTPNVVNLNNLTASTTVNFGASGTPCGGTSTDSGATSGLFTISGTITDGSGHAVPGAKVSLTGSAQGVRFTQSTGSYSFHVNPGIYQVKPAGSCSFNPTSASLVVFLRSATQNLARSSCPGAGPDAGAGDSGAKDSATDAKDSATDAKDGAVDGSPDARDAAADADAGVKDSGSDATDSGKDATVDSCVPKTCATQGLVCGSATDGCGHALVCGSCPTGQSCSADGKSCFCPTPTCAAGQTCGTVTNACGATVSCGTCTNSTVCNGTTCICPAATCPAGQNCGTATNSCGNSVPCGTCTGSNTCGGSGVPNQCGCTPTTACTGGQQCGVQNNGCGGIVNCPTCPAGTTCNAANQCVCVPTKTACTGGQQCGTQDNGCGVAIPCGTCAANEICNAHGTCQCVPRTACPAGQICGQASDGCGGTVACGSCPTHAACNANGTACVCVPTKTTCTGGQNCGTQDNGCGTAINCGNCTVPETCGGGGTPNVCGSACGEFNDGAPCTPTEQRFVDKSVDCYTCMVNGGCLDDAFFGDTGHECGDLTGNAAAGAAAGTARTQLCLDTLDCILNPVNMCAAIDVNICYCGSLGAGNDCVTAPAGAPDGACITQELNGLEFQATDPPSVVLPNYTDLNRGAGIANQLFNCAKSNGCDALCAQH